jgi:hypothetical protein
LRVCLQSEFFGCHRHVSVFCHSCRDRAICRSAAPDVKVTEPGQLPGLTIENGMAQKLRKGDVIVIPHGVPHQFTEVTNPFLHFVVKPISMNAV